MRTLLESFRPAGFARANPPTKLLDRWGMRVRAGLSGKGAFSVFRRRAGAIRESASALRTLTDADLKNLLVERSLSLRRKKSREEGGIDDFLAGLAVAVERVHGFSPHEEQLIGAMALDAGFLAELATGEGKTLVAAMGAVLLAAQGRRCHVLTANDYLAARDAALLEPLAAWCDLEVGCVTGETKPPDRQTGYAKTVVYSTAKDVLADFLRDRLDAGPAQSPLLRLARSVAAGDLSAGSRTLPPLDAAIIDEADHVLIDEAVTPLIISRKEPNPALAEAVKAADKLASELREDRHYVVDRRHREIRITPEGEKKLASSADGFPTGWSSRSRRRELLYSALQARVFYLRDHQYVVVKEKVVIVDESTGRQMPDRQWQQGLHQAVEVKEGLEPSDPTVIADRMSFQRFFRLYRRISGLTGTAWEARHELFEIYGLKVICIPTHRPCIRARHPDVVADGEEKWRAVCDHIEQIHRTGRPVLAGTRTVADSERLRELLEKRGRAVLVLNAIHHEREAEIIRHAGEAGRITIATNMAGRGTDISLGRGVAELGGLHVVAAERHASGRIDRQLFGRAGRQGDPGSAAAFPGLGDDVVQKHIPSWVRRAAKKASETFPALRRTLTLWLIVYAQWRAGQMDANRRRQLLAADYKLDESLGLPPEAA